jgi:hypothetical protein
MRQSETFLILVDDDRKQFAVEGSLTDVQPWNRAVAAAQEGATSAASTLQRHHALPRLEWQRHYGHLYRLVEPGNIVYPSQVGGLRTHRKARSG